MTFSRTRIGSCEFSARLPSPLCWRCPKVKSPGAVGRAITAQLIGAQHARCETLFIKQLAHQTLGSTCVTPRLNQNVQHGTMLVDGARQPGLPPVAFDEHFVQMPFVASG